MRLKPISLLIPLTVGVPAVVAAPLTACALDRVEVASPLLAAAPRADLNGDDKVDARDIQADDPQVPAPPVDPMASIKAHPDYPKLLVSLNSRMKWTVKELSKSPERMLATIDACAQLHALTGAWPRANETKPILRKIRDGWPLPFANFGHSLTLWHIPTMYRAATLSPIARTELEIPLRWCEARMLEPQKVGKPPVALLSTGVGTGLRDMVMLRELLHGEASAREVALHGFGTNPTQWGLPRLLDECIDDFGVPREHPAAPNHWAWTIRPAMVWLIETKDYGHFLSPEQRAKWRKFYELPCRMLCVGGKTFTIPGANDDYKENPVVGPVEAWVRGDSEIDKWARYQARKQASITIDWLRVPADAGFLPTERPPGCSGDRDFGRIKLTETATETRVNYLGDGTWTLTGGHKMGRRLTVVVAK